MHVNRRFFCCQEGCMNKNIVDEFSILLNDKHISDIRIVSHDCIYVKRDGEKENISALFDSKEEYLQFIKDITKQNHVVVNESNVLRKFTDTESFPNFALQYVLGMPLVNTKNEPYLFIRKLQKEKKV